MSAADEAREVREARARIAWEDPTDLGTLHVPQLRDVRRERERQEELKRAGKFTYTCADPQMSNLLRLAVLAEEFGEVAREVLGDSGTTEDARDLAHLREELVQVAAVAVAWVEGLDAEVAA